MPSRSLTVHVVIALMLIALCVIVRLAVSEGSLPPNFSAVASCAIFAGFLFHRNMLAAVAVPLIAMLISDPFIGGYEWRTMLVVYAALALPALLGRWMSSMSSGMLRTAMVPTFALAASVFFFLTTNFAVWMFGVLYPPTPAGLVQCFVSALPFFRYTMLGDLVFTTSLFGVWAAVTSLAPEIRKAAFAPSPT